MNDLIDTAKMMNSPDYKERFKAEYFQVSIRLSKLSSMLEKWDEGRLEFVPTCPRATYNFQIEAMKKYKDILEVRAKIEGIDL